MEAMDEELNDFEPEIKYSPVSVCKCLRDSVSSEQIEIPERKQKILSTVARTEDYLRQRRIPELIRFLLTKVISDGSDKPLLFLEKLLDDCMLFRAGLGLAPVLYEDRHLEAVVKSFDPGQRGWLTAGQIRRAYTTLGFTLEEEIDDRISTDIVLVNLKKTQEDELYNLLTAGPEEDDDGNTESSKSDTITV